MCSLVIYKVRTETAKLEGKIYEETEIILLITNRHNHLHHHFFVPICHYCSYINTLL